MKLFRSKQSASPARRRSSSRAATNGDQELEQRYNFRRNRTLTGSLSSDVVSANVHNMELRSPRVHSHDLRSHRRRLMTVLLLVLGAMGLLGFLIYQSVASPRAVASTPIPIDAARYEKEMNEYFAGHIFQRLRTTVDTRAMTAYLQENGAPEVASIDSTSQFAGIGQSRFTLTMRQPVVMWRTGQQVFYVDELGNAFERNYYPEPSVEVVDQTGIETSGNQVLASNRLLGFIGKIIGRMKGQGYTVNKVILPANTTRQVEVQLDGVAYPIKCNVDRSAGEQAEDAARAIKHLSAHGATPQYLDVRVSGKAYYL